MAPVFFKSPEHRLRWLYVLQTMGKVHAGKIDQEYGAALYVLTADLDTWQQAQMYVDRHGFDVEALHGIDFPELLAKGEFSGGYTVLIQWAGNLFNGQVHIDPVELMRLDDSNFLVALTALQLRRTSLPVSEAELYNAMIDERNRIARENRDKPWLPLHDGE